MPTAIASQNSISPVTFALPFAVGILVQLPLLIRYAGELMTRPHYWLCPLAVLATLVLAAIHWPTNIENKHRATLKLIVFIFVAAASGIAGALTGNPTLAATSCFFLVASYLSSTADRDNERSLFWCSLPLLGCLKLPFDWDLGIEAYIRSLSVTWASRFMEVIGPSLGHERTDSAFVFPDWDPFLYSDHLLKPASVFVLAAVALAYIAVTRRNLIQSALLIASCWLWAIMLNVSYLMLLPVLNIYLDIDFTTGVNHDVVRWLILLATTLMVVSTGRFIKFMFSPVDPEIGRSFNFGRFITAVWNSFLASDPFINDTGQIVGRVPERITRQDAHATFPWITTAIIAAASVIPLVGVATSWGSAASANGPIAELTRSDLPESFDDWAVTEFASEEFDGPTTVGMRRDTWTVQSPRLRAKLMISQGFDIWHELTSHFRQNGWSAESRDIKSVPGETGSSDWQFVDARIGRDSGKHGVLLYSYFDAAGEPVDAPTGWKSPLSRLAGVSTSEHLPLTQVALVYTHFSDLDAETESAVIDAFLQFRDAAKARMIRDAGSSSSSIETTE